MPRQRDFLFEAVAEACGWDWREMTKSSRGRLNAALAELRDVEATPDEVKRRAQVYHQMYPQAPLTPNALAAHWPSLKQGKPRTPVYEPDPTPVTESDREAGRRFFQELDNLPVGELDE